MKWIELEQGSPEWIAWRLEGVGGSDCASILGVSPYATRAQLLQEKLVPQPREETFAMRKGRRVELDVRRELRRRMGLVVEPACVEMDDPAWARCSLDGITLCERFVAEIKYNKLPYHECALAGTVPAHHWPQVQWSLLVTGAEGCWYASFNDAKSFAPDRHLALIACKPDAEYLARLVEAAEAFWLELCAARESRAADLVKGGAA